MRHWTAALQGTLAGCVVVAAVAAQQSGPVNWDEILEQPAAFYATPQARRIAEYVLQYQRDVGGWPKDVDMTRPPAGAPPARSDATIDNGATTTQIRFLALVAASRGPAEAEPCRNAARRGIEYLLAAQYPNGGWPQFFPLRADYSRYITYNDNAMVSVMSLLADVAAARPPFDFVSPDLRRRAGTAVERGTLVTLKAQIRVGDTLTVWGAQHDEVTLEPRAARAFEPAALSGAESVGIVRFLMLRPTTPEIVRAVDAAAAWFERARLPDGRWARFYEIGTTRPIFAGRDGIIRYRVEEIEAERREGYAWFGTWPQRLLDKEYTAWRKGMK